MFAGLEKTLFDSHCHLNDSSFDRDRDQIVESAVSAGVEHIIDVAESLTSSRRAVQNAQTYEGRVYATVGVDPQVLIPSSSDLSANDLPSDTELAEQMNEVAELLAEYPEYIKMVGETGLDNYWYARLKADGHLSADESAELLKQQEQLFRMHLDLAQQHKLPLTIHSRAAEPRCIQIASEYDATGIFHSYTGDYQTAKTIIDKGYSLGVNGIITFKNSGELRQVYHQILGKTSADWSPQDFYAKGVYFETDAPFLSPQGKRAERNQPANIKDIYEFMTSTSSHSRT